MSFGAGSIPSGETQSTASSGPITLGPIAAPVVNLGYSATGPGQMSPVLIGGIAVLVLFVGVIIFAAVKR